jgi:hypothetical protein
MNLIRAEIVLSASILFLTARDSTVTPSQAFNGVGRDLKYSAILSLRLVSS